MANGKSGQLKDMLLGNNPKPTAQGGWAKLSQREYDLLTWDYGRDSWSLACNLNRVGSGTIGWIWRADGSYGHLAGLIVFDGDPFEQEELGGVVHYCEGWLWRLPREWWIDGARVQGHVGWSGRAPFGAARRFRNGEELKQSDRAVLWQMLHGVAKDWVEYKLSQIHTGP